MCYTIERGELLNEMSDLKKQERRYQRKNQKIERRRKREEHKQYKRKVKAGKDWQRVFETLFFELMNILY